MEISAVDYVACDLRADTAIIIIFIIYYYDVPELSRTPPKSTFTAASTLLKKHV